LQIPFCDQSGVHHALNPDPYRGVFGSDGEMYAKDVQDIIDFGTSGHVAGFISEAIQVIINYSDFY
jgi:alanine-glyoxylate transaminase/(R)-3-amino-2-methylpropionate-pyruvate transaminase